MAVPAERIIAVLKDEPNGYNADELMEYLNAHGEKIRDVSNMHKDLSVLFDNNEIFAINKQRGGQRVYLHLDYLKQYKPIDLYKKPKKKNDWQICADFFMKYHTTGDEKYLTLAKKKYEDIS